MDLWDLNKCGRLCEKGLFQWKYPRSPILNLYRTTSPVNKLVDVTGVFLKDSTLVNTPSQTERLLSLLTRCFSLVAPVSEILSRDTPTP